MKTNLPKAIVMAAQLAAILMSFNALGQAGVWVPHMTDSFWSSVASSADGNKLVAAIGVDYHGYILTSANSGTTWTTGLVYTAASELTWGPYVASSMDATKLIAGANEKLWLSTDSGATWNPHFHATAGDICTGVASSADGTKLVQITKDDGLYTSGDSGNTWTHRFITGEELVSIACSDDGTKLLVGTYLGRIYTSTDSGVTWTPRIGTGASYWSGVASSADGTKLVAVDSLLTVEINRGRIYTSSDSGTNWTARAYETNWYRVASSADGSKLAAACGGIMSGSVYLSSDSGVSWTASAPLQHWTAMASSADGNKLVAAARGGKIYTYIAPVGNDQCSGAIALTPGVVYSMDTTYTTSTGDPMPTCQPNFGSGVWFKYTPSVNGPVLISTCGSSFDTVLQVFTGACGSLVALACNDDYGPACSGSRQASLSFSGNAGTTYYILVGGYNNYIGNLNIVAESLNDRCSGAIALTAGVAYSMSNAEATSAGDPIPSCGYNVGKGVWFTFTPATSHVVQIDACGSDLDTVLQVYTGGCGSLSAVPGGCNDDSNVCGDHLQSCVAFAASAGTTYYILAGGYNLAIGNLSITASDVPLAITSQPVGGNANSGDSFTFSVSAIGSGLFYQWLHASTTYSGATNSSLTVTNLDPQDAGTYQVVVSNVFGAVTSSVAVLNVLPDLGDAVDAPGLTWTTGGGNAWFRTTAFSYSGGDAATCFSSSTEPWMQTSVTGPGTLTFRWTFPGNLFGLDSLDFYVDGVWQDSIHQVVNPRWISRTIYLGGGSHTLKWAYNWAFNYAGGPAGVDQVALAAGATAAFIATQPTPQTSLAGSNATFGVGASGTPPFTYQWQFNGTSIANATNSSLTLTNVQPFQGSNYCVVVANGYGSPVTSSIVALTVIAVPLPVAVDYAGPAWSTSGNALWFGEVSMTHDSVDAAQSADIADFQSSVLQTTLVGPGTLSFWWKVSSETNFDYLLFYTNNAQRMFISGEVGWQQQSIYLSTGPQTVTWIYRKDVSLSYGQDAGWVDQVTYDGPPYLSVAPLAQNKLLLWWPHSVTGCLLQKTTNLVAPVNWQNVPDPAYWAGDNWVVTNISSEPVRFYRLKK